MAKREVVTEKRWGEMDVTPDRKIVWVSGRGQSLATVVKIRGFHPSWFVRVTLTYTRPTQEGT